MNGIEAPIRSEAKRYTLLGPDRRVYESTIPGTFGGHRRSRIYGRLGRSEGCPAIPSDVHRSVIEAIKNGSCFFVYGKDKRYASRSKLLKNSRLS